MPWYSKKYNTQKNPKKFKPLFEKIKSSAVFTQGPCSSMGLQMDIFVSSFSFVFTPLIEQKLHLCVSLRYRQKTLWGGREGGGESFTEYAILFKMLLPLPPEEFRLG